MGALGAARVMAAVTLGGVIRRRGMCVLRQCRKKLQKGFAEQA